MSNRGKKKSQSLFRANFSESKDASINKMSLYCWGNIDNTKIRSSSERAVPVEIKRPNISKAVISMDTKDSHMIAVTEDFTLAGCGENFSRQVFPFVKKQEHSSRGFESLQPIKIPINDLKIVQVSCGKDFTAYLTSIGRVYTFGSNMFGQLGHGSDRSTEFSGPRMVQGIAHEKCVQVCTGDYSTYALTQHGNVYATGCGRQGRLGTLDLERHIIKRQDQPVEKLPVSPFLSDILQDPKYSLSKEILERNAPQMTQVKGALFGTPVVRIAAGSAHCLAISSSGHVYGWGSNSHGQLGLKSPTFPGGHQELSVAFEIDSDDDHEQVTLNGVILPTLLSPKLVDDCSAGKEHSMFIVEGRKKLYVCGSNNFGQLGLRKSGQNTIEKVTKVKIEDLESSFKKIVKVSCGKRHSAILLDCGTALIFGDKMATVSSDKLHSEQVNKSVQKISNSDLFDIVCGDDMTFAMTSFDYNSLVKQSLKQKDILKVTKPIGISGVNGRISKDNVVLQIRKLLLDVTNLNASFIRPKKPKMKSLDSSSVNVDQLLKTMKQFSEMVTSDTARLRVRQLVSSVVAKLSFGVSAVTEADQLRAYFILCISPLVQSLAPSEHEMLMVSIFKLPVISRRRFFSWIIHDLALENINIMLQVLVNPLLTQLDVHIQRKKYTKQAVFICKFLQVLYMICLKVNEINEEQFDAPQVPSSAFYTKVLDGFADAELESIYKKWAAVVTHNSNDAVQSQATLTPFAPILSPHHIQLPDIQTQKRRADGPTFGLSSFDAALLSVVDNTSPDTFSTVSPELIMFKHPFLLSANMKRRFMQIDDRTTQINNYIRFFARGIEPNFIINVQRGKEMFNETVQKLKDMKNQPPILLKRPLKIKFNGEEGLDAGGVKKEFFLLLSADLFSPNYLNFSVIGKTNCLWFVNTVTVDGSYGEGGSISYEKYLEAVKKEVQRGEVFENLEIIGTVIGLAVYNDTLLDVQFPKAMYQLLLNELPVKNLRLSNYKKFDPESASNLEYILKIEDPEELEALDLRFECTQRAFDVAQEIEICPNGSEIPVTMDNREQYVNAYVTFHMYSPLIKAKAEALTKGFGRVIKADQAALSLFHPDELELLLCGTPELDFSLLKENCEYEGGYGAGHTTVQRFWNLVENFPYEKRKLFLKFCTGSSLAPVGGLKNVKFKLQRAGPDSTHLPTAHTCFNTLMLPDYSSKQKMEKMLLLAIENSEGFGLQ